jgi:tetratricopeptide (TPR) repeat protein
LAVLESLEAAGVVLRRASFEELPFQFDNLLNQARLAEKEGDWAEAGQQFEYIAEHHGNGMGMKALAAKAFFKAGSLARAIALSSEVNRCRPTVDTLLLEAKVKRGERDFHSAIELLERAEQILEGKELLWT